MVLVRLAIVVSVVFALQSYASIVPQADYVVHEKRDAIPSKWSYVRRLESDAILPMRFGLRQRNIEQLEDMLMEVSHPDSPNYSNHWSADKVAETFAPSRETIDAVKSWLKASGIAIDRIQLSSSRGWLHLNATAAEAESLLDAKYDVFAHEGTGAEHVCKSG